MITRLILLLHNGQPHPGDLQAPQLAWEHVPYYRHLFTESDISRAISADRMIGIYPSTAPV